MIYWVFAFLAGAFLPLQVGLNKMVATVCSPLWATCLSFIVGVVAVITLTLASRQPAPSMQELTALPAYVWIAGLLGLFYVFTVIVVGPKIGALMVMSLVIAGQLIASVLVDHFGAVGFPKHEITPGRIIGCLLILGGFLAIKKF